MQLDFNKLQIAQARVGKTYSELGISKEVLYRARKGGGIRPTTLHKIAAALNVDPAELIKDGEN